MTKKADKALLQAVLEPRKNGALQQITKSCAAGADPNALVPECSTSTGYVRAGSTLLTHSVHESASLAVKRLLECSADPNKEDENGWTPWMASTLADESKMGRIQDALLQFGATQEREHIGQLIRAVFAGDVSRATGLMLSDRDVKAISNFRVDLVGRQISSHNTKMLELLLKRNMAPTSTHLTNAIRTRDLASVDLLLRYGLPAERAGEAETPLMAAADLGELKIVQRLVEAGADVNRADANNIEWTAAFRAKRAGHADVADWLRKQMQTEVLENQNQIMDARGPKFRALYEQGTAGDGVSTDLIVDTLQRWDEQYGLVLVDANTNRVTVRFTSLPASIDELYEEVSDLCPDVCEDPKSLKKSLRKSLTLHLWWD